MTASSRIPMPLERTFWVVVHRWAGLTIALFLMIAGVTGAVIAFEEPLSYAIRPHLSAVPAPYPGAQPLDAVTIAERVERRTGGTIAYLPLEVPSDHVLRLFIAASPGKPALGYDAVDRSLQRKDTACLHMGQPTRRPRTDRLLPLPAPLRLCRRVLGDVGLRSRGVRLDRGLLRRVRADAAGAPIADRPPETAVAVVVAALETGLGDPPRGRL